jgi:hypothetical protein
MEQPQTTRVPATIVAPQKIHSTTVSLRGHKNMLTLVLSKKALTCNCGVTNCAESDAAQCAALIEALLNADYGLYKYAWINKIL